jgi:ubiquinone/menaquinone biosynthesis C-methylase UbiE
MIMKETEEFDRGVGDYDKWFDVHAGWFSSELAALRLATPESGRGIEIGVGTGKFALELDIHVGIEPAENMAAAARGSGIEVIPGFAEKIPLEDASFDFALMVTVDCFLQNVADAFAEAYRILKPGGAIIIGMIDKSSPLGQKYQKHKHDNPFYKYARFHDPAEISLGLEKVGFKDFQYWQTLTDPLNEEAEQPESGFGKGGFVVIKASKQKEKIK